MTSAQVAREVPASIPIEDVPLPLQREVTVQREETAADGGSTRNWLLPAAFVVLGGGIALAIYYFA